MSQVTTIIGLEVHVQLATQAKLFCGCRTQFGAEANTQTCPVCLGLPGALPVMNREALALALKTALALECEIPSFTKWDRKQYYYPDLPKGYQISQFDLPMSQHGRLRIESDKGLFEPREVRIRRAHLEEDAGKSLHDEIAGRADSVIDLNRTGTPLLEIVTEPDLRSPLEARAFLDELKLLLTYIGVSDCNMQEGSLRVDANINLHIDSPNGIIATPIVEIKNMNSFRAVERALEYESRRQQEVWEETGQKLGDVPKQTRGWDDGAGVTRGQRSKEESSDYRYFPDPDLVPVVFSTEEIEQARPAAEILPQAICRRLQQEYGLAPYDAGVLVNQGRELVDYFLAATQVAEDAKGVCNWVTQDVLRVLKEEERSIKEFPISAEQLGYMVRLIRTGELPGPRSKEVFDLMRQKQLDAAGAMSQLGIEEVDLGELEQLCHELLEANPKTVADVKGGKQQAIGALIGQAKKRNPNVDPNRFREICLELIRQMP